MRLQISGCQHCSRTRIIQIGKGITEKVARRMGWQIQCKHGGILALRASSERWAFSSFSSAIHVIEALTSILGVRVPFSGYVHTQRVTTGKPATLWGEYRLAIHRRQQTAADCQQAEFQLTVGYVALAQCSGPDQNLRSGQ